MPTEWPSSTRFHLSIYVSLIRCRDVITSPCDTVVTHSLLSQCECYQSLTAHQHQKGHTVPKQVITIATSIQVTTV